VARRFAPRRGHSNRRRTNWSAFFRHQFAFSGLSNKLLATVGFTTTVETSTLGRTRGTFAAQLVAPTPVGEGYAGAVGIGKVQIEAFNAGVAAVPGPLLDVDWDGWLYHQFFEITAGEPLSGAGSSLDSQRETIDVKAMRKIDASEIFILVLEVDGSAGAPGVGNVTVQARALELFP